MTASTSPPSLDHSRAAGTAKDPRRCRGMIRLRDKEQATTWRLSVVLLAAALVAACGGGTAIAAAKPSLPPGPVTKYRNMLAGQHAGGRNGPTPALLY